MPSKKPNYTLLPKGEADPLNSPPPQRRWSSRRIWAYTIPILFAILAITSFITTRSTQDPNDSWSPAASEPACPQYPALQANSPEKRELEKAIEREVSSEEYFQKSLAKLQGAVRIPTQTFDDMGPVGEDERWEIFGEFHAYLEKSFPLVWSKLEITKINTWALHISWPGTKPSLKPYLFMGHQDVVPVLPATVPRWTYPPFSAHYDGRFVWGRGGADCKNVVIGVLEAFETLLEKGYTPERTMIAGFGFDEEVSGPRGAKFIAEYLEERRGRDSLEMVLDEGGLGVGEMSGKLFALPGLGEKGYFDVKITVETDGGHSSVPPDHTGIGILSQIVSAIEAAPYEPNLTPANPYFTTLQCTAEYGTEMDPWLKKTIQKALTSKKAAKSVADFIASNDIFQRYLIQTSQATDIISGGVKINALPEKVYAVVNHRIAVESKVADVQANLKSVIENTILKRFPMTLDAWGEISGNISTTALGKITLENFDQPLEPSPVSPFDTDAYKIFTGTIKQIFGADTVVAPSLMTGNTDTKFYWNLSKNIYRFSPVRQEGKANGHTVDERIGMKEHLESVRLYAQLILNGDL